MTGSDADTERTGPGEEEDAVDSGKLARFLTPVPKPRSSIPPRPSTAPPSHAPMSHAPPSNEGGAIAGEPANLFSDLPVPRRNSSLLPPPGDAVTPAPAEPADPDPDGPTSTLAVETGVLDDPFEAPLEDAPEPDFLVRTGGYFGDARRRRIAIGAGVVAAVFCLFLAARRRNPAGGASNTAVIPSAVALQSPAALPEGEVPGPIDDQNPDLGEPDPAKARDLRREARQQLVSGHAEEGVALSRSAIQADPNDPEGYILLAAGLQDLGRWQESRDVFAKCVRESDRKANTECVYFATRSK